MRRRPDSHQPANSRPSLAFWLLAPIVVSLAMPFALPPSPAVAREGAASLASLVQEVAPDSLITHEKGNLRWTERRPKDPASYRVSVATGERSPWDHGDSVYWDDAFKVSAKSDTELPDYTVRFDDVLAWVNPQTGETQTMDFECHVKGLEKLPGSSVGDPDHPIEVEQQFVNGFYTKGLAHTQATYKIYPHGSSTPIDPGLFIYWCRSLNEGECVAFSEASNPGLTLTAAYLTKEGLYDREYASKDSVDFPHWKNSSVDVEETSDGFLKFTGAPYLMCVNGTELDVADGPQPFLSGTCTEHSFDSTLTGTADAPTLVLHGEQIPYSKYIQYRAVTFDVASSADASEGLTLDYFAKGDFYWEMQFNGIVVTRHLPTKTVVGGDGELPLPGDEVTFEVNQSMDDIPANLVSKLVFEDALPEGLELRSATMLVDGADVTARAGSLETSGNRVVYRFSEEGLRELAYGGDGSECTLRITAKLGDDVPYGAKLSNTATVTMNGDEARTPEAVVDVGEMPDSSMDVEPNKGVLLIRKGVDTPDGSETVSVGDRVDYDITVQNDSASTMANVVIQDSLPEGIILEEEPRLTDQDRKTLTTGSCEYWKGQMLPDGSIIQIANPVAQTEGDATTRDSVWEGTIVARVPRLAPGAVVHVEFAAAIGENASPTVTNVALAKADHQPAVSASASIKVRNAEDGSGTTDPGDNPNDGEPSDGNLPKPHLTLKKSAITYSESKTKGIVSVGETFSYEIDVNRGADHVKSVYVTDKLPKGIEVQGNITLTTLSGSTRAIWPPDPSVVEPPEQNVPDPYITFEDGVITAYIPYIALFDTNSIKFDVVATEEAEELTSNVVTAKAENADEVTASASVRVQNRPVDGSDTTPDSPDDSPGTGVVQPGGEPQGNASPTGQSHGADTGNPGAGVSYPVYQETTTPASTGWTEEPSGQQDSVKKSRIPQTDAPPVIRLATTGGIAMTGAFLASVFKGRNRRRM